MKIDHIAIAVNDVEASAKVYQKALGIDEIEFDVLFDNDIFNENKLQK